MVGRLRSSLSFFFNIFFSLFQVLSLVENEFLTTSWASKILLLLGYLCKNLEFKEPLWEQTHMCIGNHMWDVATERRDKKLVDKFKLVFMEDIVTYEFTYLNSLDMFCRYDVSLCMCSKSLMNEVRVRFAGFGAEEDEWVSVKKAVRERSIPIEPSECEIVEVGDLVLCFQESEDQAIYFDAHVLEIHRRLHDIRGCRCDFLVRYDHENNEENVRLRRLCRRPQC
ncbi:hypothetical protein MKW92_011362 [Papaver armeniacum]|nr:hypothetical protein MKW92_011362 [Papaver armeniacum]